MYYVFLMCEDSEIGERITGYLQLSGCKVVKGEVEVAEEQEEMIAESDLVLIRNKDPLSCLEVCEYIRMFTQIPIIILTEEVDEWVKIKMFQSGIDDYINEPFSQGDLLARIQANIRRYKRLTKSFGYIENGALAIECLERKVTLRGVEIFMTVKEFDILLYLAQRPNRVVSKEEIYNQIWGEEFGDGYYNSVAVYVNRIRRKIENDIDNPQYIDTVWGVGYRFKLHS